MAGSNNTDNPAAHRMFPNCKVRTGLTTDETAAPGFNYKLPPVGVVMQPLDLNNNGRDSSVFIQPKLVTGGDPLTSTLSLRLVGWPNDTQAQLTDPVNLWEKVDCKSADFINVNALPGFRCWLVCYGATAATSWDVYASWSSNPVSGQATLPSDYTVRADGTTPR